ncbi:proteasome regulatory particle base subunit, variant 2 [Lathyrus oleraceus]|uniref:Dolichyl-diphosphooligosaccharide--protein glycosyltransferase subunit 2 n=1 Tax=Pisum sativum TaxID=3888 RepID=A0A9D5A3N9_PEA|nr:proteasome regulatory particle base subunit, variant 2 [Pisum sativum]
MICNAVTNPTPISDSHRSAALQLFDGSSSSLEEAYEALRVFEILALENKPDVSVTACQKVVENLGSSSSLKDLFYALKVNGILKCKVDRGVFQDIASRLQATVNDASALVDTYYTIGSLVLMKDQAPDVDVLLADADGTFHSIKALSQSDGRWRYSSDNPESSTYVAGLALEALAGVISLASSETDQSRVNTVKSDILKLFDSIQKYDDGTFYFDEKFGSGRERRVSLSTSSSVVRGSIGLPGSAKDFFNQIESLALLESKRVPVPLVLSLPATVYSLSKKDQLKVTVNTVLGSAAPPLTVKLVRAFHTNAKDSAVIEGKELQYDQSSGLHVMGFPDNVDIGTYVFVFETALQDSGSENDHAIGGQIHVPIYVTSIVKVSNAEIAVLGSDLGSDETQKTLDLAGTVVVSLSANHLQKLRFSFQLTTTYP